MKKQHQWLRQTPARRSLLVMITLISLLLALLLILQSYTLSLILHRVFLLSQALPQVWNLMLLFLGLLVARACLTWVREVAATHLSNRLKMHVRQQLQAHLFALGPVSLTEERRGELMSTLVDGVEAIGPYFSQYLPQRLIAVLVPALVLVVLFCVDVPSGLMLLVMVPILPFLLMMIGLMTKAETQRHWSALRWMSAHFLDVLEGLMTLKLFGRSGVQEARIGQVSERFRHTTMRTLRLAFFSSFLLEEGAAISIAIIAIEVGLRLLLGQLAFQPALFIFLLTPEFFQPLRSLGATYHAGEAGATALQHIHDILKLPVSQHLPTPLSGDLSLPISFGMFSRAMVESQVGLKRQRMISALAALSTGSSKNLWVMIRRLSRDRRDTAALSQLPGGRSCPDMSKPLHSQRSRRKP